jgi:hypothetical protein
MTLNHFRIIVAVVGIVFGLLMLPMSSAVAVDPNPVAFPPDNAVFGMTYGDWSVAWWQYVVSIPAANNPATDTTGQNCALGQSSGPVFFLVGNFTSNASVTRACTVPAGKAIFLPIINTECSTLEAAPFFGSNEAALRACAGGFGDAMGISTLEVAVDGKKVKDLGSFRVQSPVFGLTLPADNILGVNPGTGSSVSDGYWLMLKPLARGNHTIHFEGELVSGPAAGFAVNVTYHLTVAD